MSFSKFRDVILVCCILVSSALGRQEEADKLLGHCGDAKTQDVMNTCYSIEFKNSEQQLNSTYQAVLQRLDQDDREPVRTAQRAWLRYRELHCQTVGFLQVGKGSLLPTVVFECEAELNRSRAKEIEAAYRTPGMTSTR